MATKKETSAKTEPATTKTKKTAAKKTTGKTTRKKTSTTTKASTATASTKSSPKMKATTKSGAKPKAKSKPATAQEAAPRTAHTYTDHRSVSYKHYASIMKTVLMFLGIILLLAVIANLLSPPLQRVSLIHNGQQGATNTQTNPNYSTMDSSQRAEIEKQYRYDRTK